MKITAQDVIVKILNGRPKTFKIIQSTKTPNVIAVAVYSLRSGHIVALRLTKYNNLSLYTCTVADDVVYFR